MYALISYNQRRCYYIIIIFFGTLRTECVAQQQGPVKNSNFGHHKPVNLQNVIFFVSVVVVMIGESHYNLHIFRIVEKRKARVPVWSVRLI